MSGLFDTEGFRNAARIAPLALPALLGFASARMRLIRDVPSAIGALNVLALYFAFPALVARSLADSNFTLPTQWGFWLVVPLSQVLIVTTAVLLSRALRESEAAGTLALVGLFGNVAYLGLPYVSAVHGPELAGVAALAVALHVAAAVSLGPLLLVRWGGGQAQLSVRRVFTQPLLWAPVVGLAARALPDGPREAGLALIAPLSAAAAPIALFMLGLYLYQQRAALFRVHWNTSAHVALRLLLAPVLTALLCLVAATLDAIQPEHTAVLILLAGMPAAITTFSFAREFDIGQQRIAATIVQSTLLAVVSLPALAWLASHWVTLLTQTPGS